MARNRVNEIYRDQMAKQREREQKEREERKAREEQEARARAQERFNQLREEQQRFSSDIMGLSAAKSYGVPNPALTYELGKRSDFGGSANPSGPPYATKIPDFGAVVTSSGPPYSTKFKAQREMLAPFTGAIRQNNSMILHQDLQYLNPFGSRQVPDYGSGIQYNPVTAATSESAAYRSKADETRKQAEDLERNAEDPNAIYQELLQLQESENWPSRAPLPSDYDFQSYYMNYDSVSPENKNAATDKAIALWKRMLQAEQQKSNAKLLQTNIDKANDSATMYEGIAEFYRLPQEVRDASTNTPYRNGKGWEPDEEPVYRYYVSIGMTEKDAREKTNSIFAALERASNAENRAIKEEMAADFQEDYPVLANAVSIPYSLFSGIASGIQAGSDYLDSLVDGDSEYKTGDPNKPLYMGNVFNSTIRSETKEDILGDNPNFWNEAAAAVYGAGMSAFDNGARILLAGPTGSLALAGVSSFGSGYQEAIERGGSPEQALLYGSLDAALEIATEKYSLDNLMSYTNKGTLASLLTNTLKQSGVEMTEEMASALGGMLADTLIMGDKSEYNQTVAAYLMQGYTPEEANRMATQEVGRKLFDTAIESLLSGGMMAGVQGAKQYGSNALEGRRLSDLGKQSLLFQAQDMPEWSQSYNMGQKGSMDSRNAYFGALENQLGTDVAEQIRNAGSAEEMFRIYRDNVTARDTTPYVQDVANTAVTGRMKDFSAEELERGRAAVVGSREVGSQTAPVQRVENQTEPVQMAENRSEPAQKVESQTKPARKSESWVDLILRRQHAEDSTVDRILQEKGLRNEFQQRTGVEVPEVKLKGRKASSAEEIKAARKLVRDTILDTSKRTATLEEKAVVEEQPSAADVERPMSGLDAENVVTKVPDTVGAVTPDGASVEVTGAKFRDGGVVVETSGGEYAIGDLSFDEGSQMGQVLSIAAEYGGNIGRNFLSNYDGVMDATVYRDAYNAFLRAGQIAAESKSFTFEKAAAINNAYGRVLPLTVQRQAYEVGLTEALDNAPQVSVKKAKRTNTGGVKDKTTQKAEGQDSWLALLRRFGKKTGIDVTLVDSIQKGEAKANGEFVAATLSMSLAADADNLLQALGHETGEFIAAFAPEEAALLRDNLLNWWVYHEDMNSVDELIKKYQERYAKAEGSKTYNQAVYEIVFDALGALTTTEQGRQALLDYLNQAKLSQKQKRTFVQKLKDAIQKILDGIKTYLKGKDVSPETRRFLSMEAKQQGEIMEQFFKALDAAVGNAKRTGEYVEQDTGKYSLSFDKDGKQESGQESREERWKRNFEAGAPKRTEYQKIQQELRDASNNLKDVITEISTAEQREATHEALNEFCGAALQLAEYWWKQTKRHKGRTQKEVYEKVARDLKKNYKSKMNTEDLIKGVQAVFGSFISNGLDTAYEDAKDLAESLIDEAVDTTNTPYELYSEARNFFKTTGVTITEADAQDITDFSDFRRRYSGRLKIKVARDPLDATIDRDYSSFEELLPGYLNPYDIINTQDRLFQIAEALDDIYSSQKRNPYENSFEETVEQAAVEMVVELTRQNFAEETFADQREKALRDAVKKANAKAKEEMDKLRKETEEAELKAEDREYDLDVQIHRLKKQLKESEERLAEDARLLEKQMRSAEETLQAAKDEAEQAMEDQKTVDAMYYGRKAQEQKREAKEDRDQLKERLEAKHAKELEDQKDIAKAVLQVQKDKSKEAVRNQKVADQMYYGRKTMEKLNRAAERLQAAKDRLEKYRADRWEQEGRTKYIQSITRIAGRLQNYLIKNTGKEHIPDLLKEPVGDILLMLDFSSKQLLKKGVPTRGDLAFSDVLNRLATAVEKAGNLDVDGALMDFPPAFVAEMRGYADEIKAAGESLPGGLLLVNQMTAEQLKELRDILTVVSTAVSNANNLISGAQRMRTGAIAKTSMDTMYRAPEYRPWVANTMNWASKFFKWDNAVPYYAFQRFGQGGRMIFDMLADGQDKMAMYMKRAMEFRDETYTKEEVQKWGKENHAFTLESGDTVELSETQIMSLYCLYKREAAGKHLLKGGMKLEDQEETRGRNKLKRQSSGGAAVHLLTEADITAMVKTLSDRQLEVADKIQKFLSTTCAEWGNKTSMLMYGIQLFGEQNYFPMEVDSNSVKVSDKDPRESSMYRLMNLGFTNRLNEKADNALVIRDIFDVFANHAADMAKYGGMVPALSDAMKWFGYRTVSTTGDGKNQKTERRSVRQAMDWAYGREAQAYFKNLMKDLNGVNEGGRGEDISSKLLSRMKSSAVGFNANVALLQPTSYLRAAAVINPNYLGRALKMKGGEKEMLEHSGIANWKAMGFYDVNIGRNVRDQLKYEGRKIDGWKSIKEEFLHGSKLDLAQDVGMKGAEKMDSITWGRLWNACKLEVRETQGLKDEALMEATAKRFRQVIYATQVVDSTLTRAQNMRGVNLFGKIITAFGSEPALSYNMLLDSMMKFNDEARRTGSRGMAWKNQGKSVTRTMAAYASAAVAAALVESLSAAIRDDDEYESFWDKYTDALFGWDGNLVSDLLPTGIPYVKDIVSILQGYDVSRPDMDGIKELYDAFMIAKELVNVKFFGGKPTKRTYYGKMTWYGFIQKALSASSTVTGVGSDNLLRAAKSFYNNTIAYATGKRIVSYQPSAESSIEEAYLEGRMSDTKAISELKRRVTDKDGNPITEDAAYWKVRGWEVGSSNKLHTLTGAFVAGSDEGIQAARKELLAHGYTEDPEDDAKKDIFSATVTAIGNAYTKDSEGNAGNGRISREDAEKYLRTYAGMDENAVYWKLKEWDSKKANPDAESYSKFDTLYTAIENGTDLSGAVQEYLEHGLEAKDISAQITKEYKPEFVRLWNSNRGEAQKLLSKLLDAYEAIGYSRSKKERDVMRWLEEN